MNRYKQLLPIMFFMLNLLEIVITRRTVITRVKQFFFHYHFCSGKLANYDDLVWEGPDDVTMKDTNRILAQLPAPVPATASPPDPSSDHLLE
jgi:hypothetical protein